MKTLSVVLIAGLLTTGCTAFSPPRDIESMAPFDNCETVDCIIDTYDGLQKTGGERWLFMEGYKDTPLRVLRDKGHLTVTEINPAWLLLQVPMLSFVMGYAEMQPGEYGDIWSCHAAYMPIPGWRYYLVHELMHCQGYMEAATLDPASWLINGLQNGYTKKQEEEMGKDNVEHWYDTGYYKAEDATWHDR